MKLVDPLLHDSRRTHYNDRLDKFLGVVQAGNKADGLNGFTQTHLIADDAAYILRI